MNATRMFEIEREGNTTIFTPTANLSEFDYLEAFDREVADALEDPSIKNLVMDFHRTDYFGSTALAIFVKMWNKVKNRNGRMICCNLNEHQQEVLDITRLARLWTICESREQALELASKGGGQPAGVNHGCC